MNLRAVDGEHPFTPPPLQSMSSANELTVADSSVNWIFRGHAGAAAVEASSSSPPTLRSTHALRPCLCTRIQDREYRDRLHRAQRHFEPLLRSADVSAASVRYLQTCVSRAPCARDVPTASLRVPCSVGTWARDLLQSASPGSRSARAEVGGLAELHEARSRHTGWRRSTMDRGCARADSLHSGWLAAKLFGILPLAAEMSALSPRVSHTRCPTVVAPLSEWLDLHISDDTKVACPEARPCHVHNWSVFGFAGFTAALTFTVGAEWRSRLCSRPFPASGPGGAMTYDQARVPPPWFTFHRGSCLPQGRRRVPVTRPPSAARGCLGSRPVLSPHARARHGARTITVEGGRSLCARAATGTHTARKTRGKERPYPPCLRASCFLMKAGRFLTFVPARPRLTGVALPMAGEVNDRSQPGCARSAQGIAGASSGPGSAQRQEALGPRHALHDAQDALERRCVHRQDALCGFACPLP